MLFHRYLLLRYPAFILSLTVFFVGRSLGDSGSCSTCVCRLRILAAASHPYCASHAAACTAYFSLSSHRLVIMYASFV